MAAHPFAGASRRTLSRGRGSRAFIAFALLGLMAEPLPAVARVFNGFADGTLTQPPVLAPEGPAPSAFAGLQYGDPASGVSLVEPPKPDKAGEAQTSYPIEIPPGRLDWQPDVSLQYGSRQLNGWLGVGWDLAPPAIAVDTRWGVPRYDPAVESETYSFEGEQLSPTAHRFPQLAREGERIFTKRVEGDYQLIIRHGATPQEYSWEIHDKLGNKFFYGRTPEGDPADDSAILRADNNAAYWWGLVEKRDISNNTVTYFYDRVSDTGVGNGQGEGPAGTQLYLSRVNYTGSVDLDTNDDGELPRFGAYDVTFTRDAELDPPAPRRKDVTIDARNGALRVTSHLLRSIDVTFCGGRRSPAEGNPANCAVPVRPVRRYTLNYEEGPFAKTLLRSVDQAGTDGVVFATHRFDYFDDFQSDLFDDDHRVGTGDGDDVDGTLGDVKPTALGGAVTSSGDGRVYLGFNPLNPDKSFSIGGGLELNGSNSDTKIQLIDVNGDYLPDKVWDDGGSVRYRLNQSGPGGGNEFSGDRELVGLPGIGRDETFGVSIGPEAYFFIGNVMYHHGWTFSKTTAYFSDVNGDGLVDFVDGGTVYFNHLDENDLPYFSTTSAGTAIPISDDSIAAQPPDPDDIAYEEAARRQFPLQDTLRRWIAPWDGAVTIEGPVTLRTADDSPDGVRVAIQLNDAEQWGESIPHGSTAAHVPALPNPSEDYPNGVIPVLEGDRVYFRVQSVDDGAADAVDWDPVITYTTHDAALDANGKDVARFVASQDFTLGGRTGIFTQMPFDGRVRVTGVVRKSRATTDDVQVVVDLNGTNLVAALPPIGASEVGDFPVDAEFDVLAPRSDGSCPHEPEPCIIDRVSLRLGVDSPIDVTALTWTGATPPSGPQLYYLSASKNGQPVRTEDLDGNPIIQLRPPYDIDIYGKSNLTLPQAAWVPDDGDDQPGETATVTAEARVTLVGGDLGLLPTPVVFTVKSRNRLLAKGTMTLHPPLPDPNPNAPAPVVADSIDVTFDATEGEEYWFDYSIREPRLAPLMVTDTDVSGDLAGSDVPDARHWPRLLIFDDSGDVFPQPYRGWAYAGYNGDGDRAGQAINEAELIFRRGDYKEGEENAPDNVDADNPIRDSRAYPYAPDPEQNRWQGPKASVATDDQDPTPRANIRGATWGAAGGLSSSRVGPDSVASPGAADGTTGRGPVIKGQAEEDSFGGGLSVGPIGFGGGVAFGRSKGKRDFLDLNGDGYPDIVGSSVQYTNEVGGLDPLLRPFPDSSVRADRSYSGTLSGSGATPKIKGSSSGDSTASNSDDGSGGGDVDPDEAGESSSGVSLGFEGGLGHSESNHDDGFNAALPYVGDDIESDLADLNGDGLPDRVAVDSDGINVQWNLGYRFSEPAHFPGGALEQGQSDSFTVGVTAGFNGGRFDFAGGVSIQSEREHADVVWIDVNGDSLPDRLESFYDFRPPPAESERTRVEVAFNTGAGLTDSVEYGAFENDDIARSESFGVGGGADFTIGIGPLCWPVKLCFIILNPGGHGQRSVSSPLASLVDIDGDGLPDNVSSSDDTALHVARNRTGRTNLLRSIHRPLGATIEIEYERDGNTSAQPFSLWVLKQVKVNDGHAGDGVDDVVTRWDYDRDTAAYDFSEREMLGYGTIAERHLDDHGQVYRSVERTYRTGSYYERGLLATETLMDGGGRPFTSTVNTYDLVDSIDPEAAADPESTVASLFPRLVSVERRSHDGSGAVATVAEVRTAYDARGNPVEITDVGEPGADDDAVARTTFTECDAHPSFPWTQVPQALTIVDTGGTVLRRRSGDTPCDYAAIIALDEHLTPGGDGASAHSDVGYADPGGQVNYVQGPANADGQREEIGYTYDRSTGALVAVEEISHGLTTTATYDNTFGRLASVTDPNGATTTYAYDNQGRLKTVTGPVVGPSAVTITFTYSATDAPDPWVRAVHSDPARANDAIETMRFIDGVGKEIQTKHDVAVFDPDTSKAADVRAVSGSTYFDFLGRPGRQFYPVTEALSIASETFNFNDDAVRETFTEYDVRDRITKEDAPGSRITTTTYGYTSGPFGHTMATTDVIDPEENHTRTYTDVRGDEVGFDRFIGEGSNEESFLTRFAYDPIQQLVTITDPGAAVTAIAYDLLGRKVSTEGPDTGRVEFGFDPASNLVSRVTPNLRSRNQQITYDYEFNRLVGIHYPADPSNDVTYTYGGPTAGDNTRGRIATLVDGARTQARMYDLAGNLVEQRDVMKVHNLSPTTAAAHTYTTRFVRDGWGRILNMTYPDGEVVTNAYDSGGLVRAVSGVKGPFTYRYVDRLEYDKFGFRRLLAFGNGVTTEDTYVPETLQLQGQVVTKGNKKLQNLKYTYDDVGNPLTRVDDIPVPPSNQKGGPSTQTFEYDDLYRLTSATGTYAFPPNKRRDFTLALTYDDAGRVSRKQQTDKIQGKDQAPTTYNSAYDYNAGQPHAPSHVGGRSFTWDADGNNTGWQDDQGGRRRTITWDEEDRASSIAEQGSTTTYRYDDDGTLAIERGPQGEVEYVSEYFTALNGGVVWKDFFAGDLRVATKLAKANAEEKRRYFLTGDLIGSVNLVTDATGLVYEHLEYFPGGEIWVRENSEVYRQPHLYGGLYHDEFRKLYRTGARWYEPHEGLMLSPDPLLVADPGVAVGEPRLLADYTYAFDNPVRLVDRSGRAPTEALTSFLKGDTPLPFLHKQTMAKRKAFEAKHKTFRQLLGTELNKDKPGYINRFTDKLDQIYSIDLEFSAKGVRIKRISLFKFKQGKGRIIKIDPKKKV